MLRSIFLVLTLFCSVAVFAQNPAATTSDKEQSETAEMLSVASRLVKYGYQTQTALPLIQAVEIYNRLGVSSETEAKSKETTSDAVVAPAQQEKADGVSYDPQQLLEDAKKYSDGDKNILELIKAAGNIRGRVGGPVRHVDTVDARSTDTYKIQFRGGETAMVIVSGDGDTDLDLYIYDENNNYITSDTDGTDGCVVTFNPRWTGYFYVKIKNLGNVYNRYTLITN